MQQTTHCPSCNSPIVEGQQFCGVCGARLPEVQEPQVLVCPGCGVQITPDQQFCGMCGTKLAAISQEPVSSAPQIQTDTRVYVSPATPVEAAPQPVQVPQQPVQEAVVPPPPPPPQPQASTMANVAAPQAVPVAAAEPRTMAAERETISSGGYGMLSIAAIIFQIVGWIVLVGGCLASIALGVLVGGIGWTMSSLFTGEVMAGTMAITMAVIGFIASIVYGFGLLAFGYICKAVVDFRKRLGD